MRIVVLTRAQNACSHRMIFPNDMPRNSRRGSVIIWMIRFGGKPAQEEDQRQSTGGSRTTTAVNTGDTPSDDISSYLGGSTAPVERDVHTTTNKTTSNASESTTASQVLETSKLDECLFSVLLLSAS